jgi:hypothetical protein
VGVDIDDTPVDDPMSDEDTGPIVMMPPAPAAPASFRPRPGSRPGPQGTPRPQSDRAAMDNEFAMELDRLARRGDPTALPQFRAALSHPAPVVQIAAARGLSELGTTDDVPQLIALLEVHAPEHARPAMIHALGAIADARAVRPLLDIVRDPRMRELHAAAAAALGRIGAREALPYLDALYLSPDANVRTAAALAAEAIRLGRSRETYDPIARLEELLVRIDALLAASSGAGGTDPRLGILDPIAALTDLGVTWNGTVPYDLARWAVWCNRPASALRWASSRGWHFLSLADALALRAALTVGQADPGAWLPIMASEFGDHQVYVPRSYREGLVYSCFSDEPIRPAGPGKSLVDQAAAIIDAWITLSIA